MKAAGTLETLVKLLGDNKALQPRRQAFHIRRRENLKFNRHVIRQAVIIKGRFIKFQFLLSRIEGVGPTGFFPRAKSSFLVGPKPLPPQKKTPPGTVF
jgi:hypothetical protein